VEKFVNIYLILSLLILTIKLPLKYKLDLKIILVAVLYYLSARLGYYLVFENTTALPAWPPSGIAFALMILLGRTSWPGITIGALVANILAFWNNPELPAQTIITVSSLIAIGHTLETLTGNFLVKRWIKDDYPFTRARNTFRFLFVTLMMSLIGSLIGTLSLNMNGIVSASDFMRTWFSWWVGNVVGILLFTPFILSVVRKTSFVFHSEKLIEIIVFAGCLLVVFFIVRMDYLNATLIRALPFLLIPFLLWMAFRFELLAAITGVLAISLISIYSTIGNLGPFILSDANSSMILLQIFISVISISTIVLSATVTERLKAERDLTQFNENLEARVQERTKELHDQIDTRKSAEEKLQRINQELSKRNTELDNFVYSVSHDLRAPIASVLGLINLAKKDKDAAMKDVYLDKINNSALQQDTFIREILDQSRNSRLDVKKEEILFEPLIDETFNQLKFATSTGKSVEKIIQVNQSGPFFSDRWRLKVILNNIISNAIRYRNGKDPVIRVNVEINGNRAKLEVEDNGKGIAREHLDKVYRMFYRATDDGAGSGLGLYIVKETIDKLNGSISIESEVGKGTTVRFEIPEIL
jgi:signal transduction histidine kinase